jgi:hypothetical protein
MKLTQLEAQLREQKTKNEELRSQLQLLESNVTMAYTKKMTALSKLGAEISTTNALRVLSKRQGAHILNKMERKVIDREADAASGTAFLLARLAESEIDELQLSDLECIAELYEMTIKKLTPYVESAHSSNLTIEQKLQAQRARFGRKLPSSEPALSELDEALRSLSDVAVKEALEKVSLDVKQLKQCTLNISQYLTYIKALHKKTTDRISHLRQEQGNAGASAASDLPPPKEELRDRWP